MDNSNQIKEEARIFIEKNNTAVIATVSGGEPYASTVHYVADDKLNIYFLSHRNTSKYLNISNHQRAAIVIGTGPKHITIQARGIVDIAGDEVRERIVSTVGALKEADILQNLPIEKMAIFEDKEPVAFKFEPLEMTFMNVDDDDYPHSKGHDYHKIY